MLCAQRKGKCNIFRGKTNLPVGVPADMPPSGGGNAHAMSWRTSPIPGGPLSPAAAGRRNGGKAYPLLRGKVKKMAAILAAMTFLALSDKKTTSEESFFR